MTDLLLLIAKALPCAKREMLLVRRSRLEREGRVACCRSTYLLTRDTLGRRDLQVYIRVSHAVCIGMEREGFEVPFARNFNAVQYNMYILNTPPYIYIVQFHYSFFLHFNSTYLT